MRPRSSFTAAKWTFTVTAAFLWLLFPLSHWLNGGWIGPATSRTTSVAMANGSICLIFGKEALAPHAVGPMLSWKPSQVPWTLFRPDFHRDPARTTLVVPFCLLALFPTPFAIALWKAEARWKTGRCLNCGYARHGLAPDAPCFRCKGKPIA